MSVFAELSIVPPLDRAVNMAVWDNRQKTASVTLTLLNIRGPPLDIRRGGGAGVFARPFLFISQARLKAGWSGYISVYRP